MEAEQFIDHFAHELVKVVGVQSSFGILMKAYENLDRQQRDENQELFLNIMKTLKKLDTRQKV